MTHTRLLFRDDALAKVLAGATLLTDAVRGTLGPKSKSAGVLLLSEATLTDIEEEEKHEREPVEV